MARVGGAPLPTITDDRALGFAEIQRSLRFNRADAPYLQATLGNSNVDKWTWSGWVKKTVNGQHQNLFSSGSDVVYTHINFDNSDRIRFQNWHSAQKGTKITTRKIRDLSSWMHIVVIWDSGNSTADDRMRIYVNGTRETSFSSSTNPDQNQDSVINGNSLGGSDYGEGKHFIGKFADTSDNSGTYKTEIHFIDGYAYDPSYFGFTDGQTGIWMPKRYEGTYGTNGFYLDFSDNSSTTTLGIDKSPNGNDFTLNNFSVSAGIDNDSLEDTPTNNFCTLNALDKSNDADVREGGLSLYTNANDQAATGTFAVASGKWYWESVMDTTEPEIGIAHDQMPLGAKSVSLPSDGQIALIVTGADGNSNFLRVDGNNSSGTGISGQSGPGTIGIALDMDNKKIWFTNTSGNYFNSGNPATGANAAVDFSSTGPNYPTCAVRPIVCVYQGANKQTYVNFGQRPFTYTAPEGYKTLSSKNLRDHLLTAPSVIRPKKHFDVLTYTGDGSSSNEVTGLEFKPDLVWIKSRSGTTDHVIQDSVRGNYILYPNTNAQEGATGGGWIKNMNEHGFVTDVNAPINTNSATYVAWCWKAGGASVSNSDGSITSTISANQEAGFSIVTWTGTGSNSTVGHGLGKAPKVVICKLRDTTTQDWFFMPGEITGDRGKYIKFNDTGGIVNDIHTFPATATTSTVFTVGGEDGGNGSNGNGSKYVAYCWAEIPGYSKFDTYTGNLNTDGPFVHLGFRPAWLLIKRPGDHWILKDSTRNSFNDVYSTINHNSNSAEHGSSGNNQTVDFLSNGFKIRGQDSGISATGESFIYMAFAEQPGVSPYNTIINAR